MMIRSDKFEQAVRAIQHVIIRGRTMAYQAEPAARIAELLDHAEYLPQLILAAEDRTEIFADYLKMISEQYQCRYIFTEYSRAEAGAPTAMAAQ